MMWCGRVRKQLSAYVDGELVATQEQSVAQHVARCEQCAGELRELRGVARLAGLIPEEDVPTGLHARIMAGISGAKLAPPARAPRRHSVPYGPWAFTAFAGASALLLLGVMQSRAGMIPSTRPAEREPALASTEAALSERDNHKAPEVAEKPRTEPHSHRRPIVVAKVHRPEPLPEVAVRKPAPEAEPAAQVAAPAVEKSAPAPAARGAQPMTARRRTEKPAEMAVAVPRTDGMRPLRPDSMPVEPRNPVVTPTAPTVAAVPGEPVMNMMPAMRETTMAGMTGKPGVAGMAMETRPDSGMARMAGGSTPAEAESLPAKEEGLEMLRMLLEERSRSVPQPPSVDPMRDRRRTRSL